MHSVMLKYLVAVCGTDGTFEVEDGYVFPMEPFYRDSFAKEYNKLELSGRMELLHC